MSRQVNVQLLIKQSLEQVINLPWDGWKPMPEPKKGSYKGFTEHVGFGVYQLKNAITNENILFGTGTNCKRRMKSLYGSGTRNNIDKKNYVIKNWQVLVWRIIITYNLSEAEYIEAILKAGNDHLFNS